MQAKKKSPVCHCFILFLCVLFLAQMYTHCSDRIFFRNSFEEHMRLRRKFGWGSLRSPLLINGDRVFFLQSDLTFTTLNLNTGEVLNRDIRIRRYMDEWFRYENEYANDWWVAERTAYAKVGASLHFIDLKTGKLHLRVLGKSHSMAKVVVYGKYLFLNDKDTERIVRIDMENMESHVYCKFKSGDFDVIDDRLVVFSKFLQFELEKLECFHVDTGKLVWSQEAPEGTHWVGVARQGSKIQVFSVSNETYKKSLFKRICGPLAA